MILDVSAYLGHFAFRRLRYNTAAGLLTLMDRSRIDRAVVSSASAIAYRNPQEGNEELLAEIKPHADRFTGFAVLNPAYAGWLDDLKMCGDAGMRGVRLYPRWHNYRLRDSSCLRLVEAATNLGMLISIPYRVEDRRQGSWLADIPDVEHDEVAQLIKAAPSAHFILVNGSGFTGSVLGRGNNGLPANYVVDMARVESAMGNELGRLIENLGEDRVVFGTGIPFHYPGPALAKMEILAQSPAVKQKIEWHNAAKLLRL